MNANTNGMSGKGRKEVKSGGTGWFMFILKVGFFFFNAETGQDEWKNRMADIMLRYDL